MDKKEIEKLARLVRYYILVSTTKAGSGHPTSSLSAADLMTTLMFNSHFRFDPQDIDNPNNDRLIFSKGHASPLLYSLYCVADQITEKELLTLRKFNSRLEGHPTMQFPFTEAATGSLGQGLSIGLGMALNARLDSLSYNTFVLLGDSEMAEGSVWEAVELASYYKLNNLIAIVDVNRLGQRGETMLGHHTEIYKKRFESFGWQAIRIDGHSITQIEKAFKKALESKDKPVAIIAKTIKGKGVKFIEDKNGWHGKTLKEDELLKALREIGPVDRTLIGSFAKPKKKILKPTSPQKIGNTGYKKSDKLATRKAYGKALARIYPAYPEIVVLDAEVSNSTYSETFKKVNKKRFYEMFIAEQNMVGAALGFSRRGKIPFISTFAAFFTRAFDQIRMAQYSDPNITFCGSHAGVSIGADGSSQMGLEDLAMFRAIHNSTVLYPSDAVSTEKIVEEAAKKKGLIYIRTTRADTPIIYGNNDRFPIGGFKVLKESKHDKITIIAAGITLHEALKAHKTLKSRGINVKIIDLYTIKPLDKLNLRRHCTKNIITVEDHYPEGGIGETISSQLHEFQVHSLAVRKMPMSGTPEELLNYEEISENAIIRKVKELL